MADDQADRNEVWRDILSRPLDIAAFHPLSSALRLDVGAVSSCGKANSYNTDHYLAVRLGRLQETIITSLAAADLPPPFEEYAYAMLVADGLGGDAGGARASRLALSTLAHLAICYGKWNVRVGPGNTAEMIEQGEFLYRQVNEAVRSASKSDVRLADMATSLTAVYIAGSDLFFAHVGHSRAFLFRSGVLIQLTTDHTLEERGLEALKPEPKRDQEHVVTETIGGRPDGPDVAIEHIQLWTGDRVLLCTNGLTDVVSADRIADVLASKRRPTEDCQRLVDLALAAGGQDDVTVLLADYWIRLTQETRASGTEAEHETAAAR